MRRLVLGLAVLGLLVAAPASQANDDGRPPANTPIMQLIINYRNVHIDMPVVEGTKKLGEAGFYPMHYRMTNWPDEGETVAISAHHYTHALPGHEGGPFRYIDELQPGKSLLYLKMLAPYGTGTYIFRMTGQISVFCGTTWSAKYLCPKLKYHFGNMKLRRVVLTTCIGDGSRRRVVYFYFVKAIP